MYQCFIRNDYDAVQSTAEMRLGGKFLFSYFVHVGGVGAMDIYLLIHSIFPPLSVSCRGEISDRQPREKIKEKENQLLCTSGK